MDPFSPHPVLVAAAAVAHLAAAAAVAAHPVLAAAAAVAHPVLVAAVAKHRHLAAAVAHPVLVAAVAKHRLLVVLVEPRVELLVVRVERLVVRVERLVVRVERLVVRVGRRLRGLLGTLVLVRWGGFRLMISDSLGKLRFRRLPLVRLLGCSLIRLRSLVRRRWRVFGRSRFRRCQLRFSIS